MSKKSLGLVIQVVSVILWIALPAQIVPWKALLGIAGLIIGGYIYRKGRKEQSK